MVLIYGWGKDLKDVAYAGIEKCPNCKNYSNFWLREHSSNATLYFVKVARWNKKLLYICETCDGAWEVSEEKKEELIRATIQLPSREQCLAMWNHLNSSVNQVVVNNPETEREGLGNLLREALIAACASLKTRFQDDHVSYIASRFVAYLQDPDKPA